MDLVPYIFHELQEPGSQLCAQHCINNLLQQHCYSEFDLADVAQRLDQAESAAAYRAPTAQSYNYDDTGFFSISVLEKALQVWDLTLVRWRGEAMRPYQDKPEEQAGFILNLDSHWFSLRRFGFKTRWYNLNSFLPQPEWISPTFLQMVLQQAEAEGYSVFVVRKAGEGAQDQAEATEAQGWNDGGIGVFPEAHSDLMALQLGHSHGRGSMDSERDIGSSTQNASTNVDPSSSASGSYEAGSGRRRRRQEDPTSDLVEEQDQLPAASSAAPRRRYVFQEEDEDAEDLYDEELPDLAAFNPADYGGPTDFTFHDRSYDDEDAALQAALKASMDDAPQGWTPPSLPPQNARPAPSATQLPDDPVASQPAPNWWPAEHTAQRAAPPAPAAAPPAAVDEEDEPPVTELSADEIRRARLARFNAPPKDDQEESQ